MGMAENMAIAIGAAAALLLQALLAPALALGGIVPNFLMAYALAVGLARPHRPALLLPFLLGMAFDLMGGTVVGAMALLLLLVSAGCQRLLVLLDNDSLFMPLGLLVAGVFAVELLYACLLVLCGFPVGLGEAWLFRSLPCALYDGVLAVALFFLMRFVLARMTAAPRELPIMR